MSLPKDLSLRWQVSPADFALSGVNTNVHKTIGQIPIVCFALLTLALPNGTRAQFTGNHQTNIISGVTSNWPGDYYVGSNYVFDVLLIQDSGVLSNSGNSFIGYAVGASNNTAAVLDSGSVWSSSGSLAIGSYGPGNRLIISNGGKLIVSGYPGASVGQRNPAGNGGNNSVLVSGPGSIWSNRFNLSVGQFNSGNTLTVSNGGAVYNSDADVGDASSATNNTVLVTGTGSVWSNYYLYVGYDGSGNALRITNGGVVQSVAAALGYNIFSSNNSVLVSGPGSIWSNPGDFCLGCYGSGNSLTMINGGAVYDGNGKVGYSSSSNSVLVTGPGSIWSNSFDLYVGVNGASNTLAIANSASVIASNAYVAYAPVADGNRISLTGGSLYVTNAAGNGALDIRRGTLVFVSGTIITDRLLLTNGSASAIAFNGGVLNSGGTGVTNAQQFVVGNGTNSATFHLLGGEHSFSDGLRIRTNSSLTGCGTINGSVLVDTGGTVLAEGCGSLAFIGSVTNNGVLMANNGSVLESSGTLVNNGKILLFNGGTTNFHGTFINNGSVLNAGTVLISNVHRSGNDVLIQIPSVTGFTYRLRLTQSLQPQAWTDSGAAQPGTGGVLTFTDPGAATNASSRFYHVRVE